MRLIFNGSVMSGASNSRSASPGADDLVDPQRQAFVRWTILSVTTISSFMVAFDANVVAIALPVMGRELSSGISIVGWVITAYIIASAALLLQSGKVSDRYGRKRIYLLGFALFGLSSALCGLSESVYQLLGFRVVQGASAALLSATSAPLVFDSFPINQRGVAIGVNSIAWAVGSIAGPVGGGLLISLSWRFIFYINVPIAIAAVLVGRSVIPRRFDQQNLDPRNRVNVLSSILLAITVATIVMWLTLFSVTFALLGVGGLLVLFFYERRARTPLMNRELLKNKGFVYSISALAVAQVAGIGIPFVLSYYFQIVVGFSPILTGILIAPMPAMLALSSPLAGRLFDRLRFPGTLAIAGAILEGVATIALGWGVGAKAELPYLEVIQGVLGIAGGLLWTPLLSTTLSFVKPTLRGIANGTTFTFANIGFAASIAIAVAVSASYLPQSAVSQIYLGSSTSLSTGDTLLFQQGMARALLTLGVVNFFVLPLAYLTLREQRRASRMESD